MRQAAVHLAAMLVIPLLALFAFSQSVGAPQAVAILSSSYALILAPFAVFSFTAVASYLMGKMFRNSLILVCTPLCSVVFASLFFPIEYTAIATSPALELLKMFG